MEPIKATTVADLIEALQRMPDRDAPVELVSVVFANVDYVEVSYEYNRVWIEEIGTEGFG